MNDFLNKQAHRVQDDRSQEKPAGDSICDNDNILAHRDSSMKNMDEEDMDMEDIEIDSPDGENIRAGTACEGPGSKTVFLRPGSIAGLGYEIDPELLLGRTDKLLQEFGLEDEKTSPILLVEQELQDNLAKNLSYSEPNDYSYSPEEQFSPSQISFSMAAYDFSSEQDFDAPNADYNSQVEPSKKYCATESAIPWRNNMPDFNTSGTPLKMGVVHGSEVLESEDPIFLKNFLDENEAGEFEATKQELKDTALVIGVKFRQYGPVYFFTSEQKVSSGASVLVETEQGIGLAEVVAIRRLHLPLPPLRTAEGTELPIKPIKSLASPKDIAAASDNKILASSAFMHCKECIRERSLDMKLVDVEVLHDRSKIVFYFTAPARIDFRELVKDLVRAYRTRIELRQIGVRHETQMLGALGNCGMACCCRRYLRRFAPVTIKMAKEQNLFLNPAKLSGVCGRLLCCLSYEQENYEEFHRRCPKIGKKYQTIRGPVKIMRANLFRQQITVLSENNEELEMSLEEWQELSPKRIDTNDAEQNHNEAHDSDNPRRPSAKTEHRRQEQPDRPDRHNKPKPRPRPANASSGGLDDSLDVDPSSILPEDNLSGPLAYFGAANSIDESQFIEDPEDQEDFSGSIFGITKPKADDQEKRRPAPGRNDRHRPQQHKNNGPTREKP